MTDTDALRRLVEQQALDDGLWFLAQYASEAYLQHALRQLHSAVEAELDLRDAGRQLVKEETMTDDALRRLVQQWRERIARRRLLHANIPDPMGAVVQHAGTEMLEACLDQLEAELDRGDAGRAAGAPLQPQEED